jgi:PP-loop superfamily ATP-utilizing enzyme
MGAYTPDEERVIEKVIEEAKKLVKKYGFKHTIAGCNRYFHNMKSQKKLLSDIQKKEQELNKLKNNLIE